MHAARQSASAIAKAINCSNGFWLTMAATCALQMHYALKLWYFIFLTYVLWHKHT